MFFNYFIDFLWGIDILKLFGLSKKYVGSIYYISEWFRKVIMSILKIVILLIFVLDFFMILLVVVVVVFFGLSLLNGMILLFFVLVILILVFEFFLLICDFLSDYYVILDGKNFF